MGLNVLTVLSPWLATYSLYAFGVSARLTGFVPTVTVFVITLEVVLIWLTEFVPKFAT